MNKPAKMVASALVGGTVLLTAACGSSSDRPSTNDLKNAIMKHGSKVTESQAACLADVFENSKLSDATLKQIRDGKVTSESEISGADQSAVKAVLPKIMACASR